MKKIIFSGCLFLAAVSFVSFTPNRDKNSIKNKIDNILKWEEKFGFNGSVLVVKDGEVLLNKGYGYANKGSGFDNTPKTAFYIASVSKPITALAIMKLVESKRINLQDHLANYFPNVPEDKKAITLEMLLTHTSGFKHTYSCDDITDRSKAIETILGETQMVAAPGVKFNYSGDNYTLLAAIIEIISGEKFETFVGNNILKPAGIDTHVFTGDIPEEKYNNLATPAANSAYKSLKDIEASWGRKGRAGLILSVEDLYKLDIALSTQKIFNQDMIDDMLSPKIKNIKNSNYGYGFTIDNTIRGTKVFGHSGDDDAVGHNVSYLDFPDEKIKIFIASNSGLYSGTSWSAIISSLLQRFLFQSNYTYPSDKLFYNEFVKFTPQEVEKYEGVYQSGNTAYHVWINNDQQLILSPVGGDVAQTFGYPDAYIKKNILARSILEETRTTKYPLLQSNSRDNTSFEKMKNDLNGMWQSLEKKNGPLERIEILGTANIWGGNYQADIATWFKLIYKSKTLLYRLEWDGNDKIAGLGGSRIPYPMMFTLNGITKTEFIGFDVANGRTIAVNFSGVDQKGKPHIEVNIGENKPLILFNSEDVSVLPKRSAGELLYNIIISKGIADAIKEASEIKEKKSGRFDLDEGELNDFGYKLLNDNKRTEAIAMFTILVLAFPESANGFDSLGEAYMKDDNKEEAIKNYKRSLELDPKNDNARKMIKTLNGK